MKRKTIFLSLLLSVFMMLSMIVTSAGAAFTNYAKQTKLFTSYAGYDIHVDDYYNLMKEYVGKKYTYSYNMKTGKVDQTVDWKGYWAWDLIEIITSECTMDANGTIQISQYSQYHGEHVWVGVSVTKDGNLNETVFQDYSANNDGTFYRDVAWNATTNKGNIYMKSVLDSVQTFQDTYYGLNRYMKGTTYGILETGNQIWRWDDGFWMSDIIREYNWRPLSYTFYTSK